MHDSIRYNELLRAIRSKEVKELVMAQQGADRVGVVFKSGVVKMVQLPSDDCAVADMMSVHGVPCVLTKTEPPPPPSADNSLSRVRSRRRPSSCYTQGPEMGTTRMDPS